MSPAVMNKPRRYFPGLIHLKGVLIPMAGCYKPDHCPTILPFNLICRYVFASHQLKAILCVIMKNGTPKTKNFVRQPKGAQMHVHQTW
jgi:hypothetical protein